ncbi:MAG TPA: hypothetical protein V6D33_08920 [Cyanophyceae cyanobacterium]
MDNIQLSKIIASTIAGGFRKGTIINISSNGKAQVRLEDSRIITALPNVPVTGACDVVLVDGEWYAIANIPQQLDRRQYARRYIPTPSVQKRLDAAILYAVRETKGASVEFINPTWEMTGTSDQGYICTPQSKGDRGEYPSESQCLFFANQYRQEYIDFIDESYEIAYSNWLDAMSQRDRAYATIETVLPQYLNGTSVEPNSPNRDRFVPVVQYANQADQSGRLIALVPEYRYSLSFDEPDFNGEGGDFRMSSYNSDLRSSLRIILDTEDENGNPLPAPVRPPDPPFPTANPASSTALSFYFKRSFKADPIKIIEINEMESFEAILFADKTSVVPILKLGREKNNEFVTEPGDTSSSGAGDSYWIVIDQEAWHQISVFYDVDDVDVFLYGSSIDFRDSFADNYQLWRVSNYLLYPSVPQNQYCQTGKDYLLSQDNETRYKKVADYQSLTNFKTSVALSASDFLWVAKPSIEGKTYNFDSLLMDIFNPGQVTFNLTQYKAKTIDGDCSMSVVSSTSKIMNFPESTVFYLVKSYVL